MFSVNKVEDLHRIEEKGALVAVFLATGYDVGAIEWLYDVWDEIHVQSGYLWHLAVPVCQIERNREIRDKHNYNPELARDLMTMYGLDPDDLPCLVLDSFREDHNQLRVQLPPEERERRRLIEAIQKYIAKADVPQMRELRPLEWRNEVNRGLFDHLGRKATFKKAFKFAPRVATAVVRAGWRGSTGT